MRISAIHQATFRLLLLQNILHEIIVSILVVLCKYIHWARKRQLENYEKKFFAECFAKESE